jgi:hypothetical protein
MASLVKLFGAGRAVKGNAPGESVVADGQGFAGQTIKPEVYQAPGVFAVPGDGTTGIYLPVGSSRYGVVIAVNNYKITFDLAKGEAAIFSTDAGGSAVAASVILRADGTIEIGGAARNFVTWKELDTALQAHVHGPGTFSNTGGPVVGTSGSPIGLDISAAMTENVKTG